MGACLAVIESTYISLCCQVIDKRHYLTNLDVSIYNRLLVRKEDHRSDKIYAEAMRSVNDRFFGTNQHPHACHARDALFYAFTCCS